MKQFKVFYCFNATGEDVAQDKGIVMDEADIYSKLLGRLEDGDFFGIIDADDNTLQVMYDEGADEYWTEIPVVAEGGSYGRTLTFDEITDLFKALPDKISLGSFPTFAFTKWS